MMQLHVSGRLVRDPAPKTSANGKAYVHALMTASSGDGETLISLMVFDPELSNLLASLKKGDSLSAMGSALIRGYTDKEGNPAAGVTLMVNRLMVMLEGKVAPRPRGTGPRRRMADTQAGPPALPPASPFNDRIPF